MNSMIISCPPQLTMTSQDIAELVDSRHDKVKQSIERLSVREIIQLPPLGEVKNHLGQTVTVYLFSGEQGRRDSIIVVAQLSPDFTARLVDRWQELEQQAAKPTAPALPQTYLEALEHLVIAERSRIEAEGEVKRLQQVCQIMTDQFSEGMTPPVFCRQLNGVNIQKVQGKLVDIGMLRKTDYGYRSMPQHRDKLFIERHEVKDGRPVEMVTLTQKGAKRLYKMYLAGELTMKAGWDGHYSHMKFEAQEVSV